MVDWETVDIREYADETVFGRTLVSLSPERRKKIEEIKNPKGRLESLGATVALDKVLKKYGYCEKNMRYGYSERGKPFFLNEEGLYFNLSHSGDLALAVISDKEIGCDIEKTRLFNPKLFPRFLNEMEFKNIASIDDPAQKNKLFCRYWTMKESFLKLNGLGLTGKMSGTAYENVIFDEIKVNENYCAMMCRRVER